MMQDGNYWVRICDGSASVYDDLGGELVGADFREFAEFVARSTAEKKAADYERNISAILKSCAWKQFPKIKEIKNKIPSVYIIGVPHLGIVKIGRSESARTRMRHHARYTEKGMDIIGVFECPDNWHMTWLETALHHNLKRGQVQYKGQTEWFRWGVVADYMILNFGIDIEGKTL